MFKLKFSKDLERIHFHRSTGLEIVIGMYPNPSMGLGVKICKTADKPTRGEFQDEYTGTKLEGLYLKRKISVFTFRKSAGKWTWISNKINLRMPAYYIDNTLQAESREEAKIRKQNG